MRQLKEHGLKLAFVVAVAAGLLAAPSCRGGESSWWDPWSGEKYLADAGDITTDPSPVIATQLAHITVTFNTTTYTELVSKQSVLDPATRTLTVTVYARERDGRPGAWDGTLVIAASFPEPGAWRVVIPQRGDRTVGADIFVSPTEDAWADEQYLADAGDISVSPEPIVSSQLAHITINFNVGDYTELISQESVLDPVARVLRVTVYARDRVSRTSGWLGSVVVPVTFPSGGMWRLVIPQETGEDATVDLYVQTPEGAPVEDVWSGGSFYPNAANITTDPDPLVANQFSHINVSFNTTTYTELISQEWALDRDNMTLTVTVTARNRADRPATWDGTVVIPVTFLASGTWTIVIPQEGDTQATTDIFVQPEEGAPEPVLWSGDPYLPDAADVTTTPDPLQVNQLSHITINFNITSFTDLISQESSLDPATKTLTVTVYARERDNQPGGWDGTAVIPVTFLERGVWNLLIEQENDREVSVDLYVYPEEDTWAGMSYLPNAGDITVDPDPVVQNQLTHVTVNFNTTTYTELVSQGWTLDPVGRTLTITVYARERADKTGTWNGAVTVPVTFLDTGVWTIIIPQEGGGQAETDIYVQPAT